MNQAKEILETLAERFAVNTTVKNLFGEPIEAHGRTVIPVARLRYRMGAGYGSGNKPESSELVGGGAGGGGAVTASPAGVLEITDAGVHFVRFFDFGLAAGAFASGYMAALLLRRRKRSREKRLR